MAVQLIKDDNGKTQYAVIPYHEYFRMLLQMSEIDDETDDDLEDIEGSNTIVWMTWNCREKYAAS